MPRLLLPALLLTTLMFVPACGEKESGRVSGATSPQALLEKVKHLGDGGRLDVGGMISLVRPKEQPSMALTVASIALALAPTMARFPGNDEVLAAFAADLDAFAGRYDLDALKPRKSENADLSEDEKLAQVEEAMADIDPIAFAEEAFALFDHFTGDQAGTTTGAANQGFIQKLALRAETLQIDGDRATVKASGDRTLVLVKESDGRWYIDAVQSSLLGDH